MSSKILSWDLPPPKLSLESKVGSGARAPERRQVSATIFGEMAYIHYPRRDSNAEPLPPEGNALSS
jgi:hypothetical protein